ncbi:MAG TPA: hypothetical protein VFY41_07510, partial [Nitrososphaeraceae archaeon]|nr:hypothetical protein [Nitrososphaeraceae archaeon]
NVFISCHVICELSSSEFEIQLHTTKKLALNPYLSKIGLASVYWLFGALPKVRITTLSLLNF